MKCRRFLSFVFVAFLAFFSGLFITTQNSFALENTYTFDSTVSSSLLLCSNSDSSVPSCSDYSYLIIDSSITSSSPNAIPRFLIRFIADYSDSTSTRNFSVPSEFIKVVFSFPSHLSSLSFRDFYNFINQNYISSFSVSLTLTSDSPFGSSSSPPSGNLDISSNGTYDVTNYASATVNVPAEVIQGDYHDDLVAINNSILVCAAVCLVIYFFYCIYRLIIKNSGVH